MLKFDTEFFAVCSDFFSEISSNKVETRNREGERSMAKGILRNKRKKGRLLAVAVLVLAVTLMLQPVAPASAVPVSPAEADAAPRTVPAEPAGSEQEAAPEPEKAPEHETAQAAASEPAEETVRQTPETPGEPAVRTVPESEAAEDSYFADAVFLGDSRTEGFHLYSGLEEGQYLYAVGATVESVFTKATQETEGGKVPILDALAEIDCGKVYIMLGVNELGWPRSEVFREQYGKVIDRVREEHPEAEVVIQSLLPVSAKQEAKGSYVNNRRIAEFNALLEDLAAEKSCPYLDVAEAVTGEDGCLRQELTTDGVHLNTAGCQAWLEYLKQHPV